MTECRPLFPYRNQNIKTSRYSILNGLTHLKSLGWWKDRLKFLVRSWCHKSCRCWSIVLIVQPSGTLTIRKLLNIKPANPRTTRTLEYKMVFWMEFIGHHNYRCSVLFLCGDEKLSSVRWWDVPAKNVCICYLVRCFTTELHKTC